MGGGSSFESDDFGDFNAVPTQSAPRRTVTPDLPCSYLTESFVQVGALLHAREHAPRRSSLVQPDEPSEGVATLIDSGDSAETAAEQDTVAVTPAPAQRRFRLLHGVLVLALLALAAIAAAAAAAVNYKREADAWQARYIAMELEAERLEELRKETESRALMQQQQQSSKAVASGSGSCVSEVGTLIDTCWVKLQLGDCGKDFFGATGEFFASTSLYDTWHSVHETVSICTFYLKACALYISVAVPTHQCISVYMLAAVEWPHIQQTRSTLHHMTSSITNDILAMTSFGNDIINEAARSITDAWNSS
jgi:hypothetical protein